MIFRTCLGSGDHCHDAHRGRVMYCDSDSRVIERPAGMHTELSTLKPELSLLQMALCCVTATSVFRKASLTIYQTIEWVVSPSIGRKSPVRANQTMSALLRCEGLRVDVSYAFGLS